jgi:hypothetical protein
VRLFKDHRWPMRIIEILLLYKFLIQIHIVFITG